MLLAAVVVMVSEHVVEPITLCVAGVAASLADAHPEPDTIRVPVPPASTTLTVIDPGAVAPTVAVHRKIGECCVDASLELTRSVHVSAGDDEIAPNVLYPDSDEPMMTKTSLAAGENAPVVVVAVPVVVTGAIVRARVGGIGYGCALICNARTSSMVDRPFALNCAAVTVVVPTGIRNMCVVVSIVPSVPTPI